MLTFLSVFGIFLIPAILIALRAYLYAIIAIGTIATCFALFIYYLYLEIYPIIVREHLEEQEIMHRFNGDKEKIRFYKGFKKHFNGDFDLEGLKKWFMNHPR